MPSQCKLEITSWHIKFDLIHQKRGKISNIKANLREDPNTCSAKKGQRDVIVSQVEEVFQA
jgi:hypothetical protein